MHTIERATTLRLLGVLSALCLIISIANPEVPRNLYEDIALAIDPSAARASDYAEMHLDAGHPVFYDIDRAEYLYRKAYALDPRYPYVNHQLARIAFLRGDFPQALSYINKQIELFGNEAPNSYYIRALIEGYAGNYASSTADYAQYLKFDSHNWAAINDYAWALLKAKRAHEAVDATSAGLAYFPDNPWLLNTNAIALYEIGALAAAREKALAALQAVASIQESDWLRAYPGNDPKIAVQGIAAFKRATEENAKKILAATSTDPHF